MKLITVFLNVAAFIFTCFVMLTDGISKEVGYNIFALLLIFVPIFNLVIILSSKKKNGWFDFHIKRKAIKEQTKTDELPSKNNILKIAAIIFNIILLGFICYVLVRQLPQHLKERGFYLYSVIVFLTPILSFVNLAFYKE